MLTASPKNADCIRMRPPTQQAIQGEQQTTAAWWIESQY